jgi:hypothetical protein
MTNLVSKINSLSLEIAFQIHPFRLSWTMMGASAYVRLRMDPGGKFSVRILPDVDFLSQAASDSL